MCCFKNLIKVKFPLVILVIFFVFSNCESQKKLPKRPNVILIMADDIGFECLSINGSTSYKTPVLDSLARTGVNFTRAISQPLCTPSRVKIMTGKRNYKNYEYFTYLNPNQKTFGNLFKENGYKTAIVGKWQLNGLQQKIDGYEDNTRPHHFGFDEYSLWQLTQLKKQGERFSNPLIEQNGKLLNRDPDAYGPDVVSNYAIDFIKRNKDNPFFIYYPMLLVHNPFMPTPDSKAWDSLETRVKPDNKLFIDMVAYMDKIIGNIVNELKVQGIAENTLLIFVGDNGTNLNIVSNTNNGQVKGAKGNTITHGNHVPMVASWPASVKKPKSYNGLINFSDFYATFAAILNVEKDNSDGVSFEDTLTEGEELNRETATIYYDPMWGKNSGFRNIFSQTDRYKLYKSGEFYDMKNDLLEKKSLKDTELSESQLLIKEKLQKNLDQYPDLPKEKPTLNIK